LEKVLGFVLAFDDYSFDKLPLVQEVFRLHPQSLEVELETIEGGARAGMVAIHLCLVMCYRSEEQRARQLRIISFILSVRPVTATFTNKFGETPLHLICQHSMPCITSLRLILYAAPNSTNLRTNVSHKLPLHVLMGHRPMGPNLNIEAISALVTHCPAAAMERAVEERLSFSFSSSSDNAMSERTVEDWSPLDRARERNLQWFIGTMDRALHNLGVSRMTSRPCAFK
jgi:hypothetical protein